MLDLIMIPKEKMVYRYSHDILDVYLEVGKPMVSEEITNGIYEHFDLVTDNLLGVSIENYKHQDKDKLHRILPFWIDFDYVDNEIIKQS